MKYVVVLAIVIIYSFLVVWSALAHGIHHWIADNELRDPTTNAWCCSKDLKECEVLKPSEVTEVSGGYSVKGEHDLKSEFVPYSRALPFSPDGEYHRCGSRNPTSNPGLYVFNIRCFIIPPGQT